MNYSALHKDDSEDTDGRPLETVAPTTSSGPSIERRSCISGHAKIAIVLVVVVIVGVCVQFLGKSRPPFTIILFGDSLVSYTDRDFHFSLNIKQALAERFPQYDIHISCSGIGGNRALNLRNRMYDDVLHRRWLGYVSASRLPPPDAVIIYFDSDATDVNETGQVTKIRDAYYNNLGYVIKAITSEVKYVALGGPTLFGELPWGQNRRDDILDAYREMNRNLSITYGITYLETRDLFWSNLPHNWSQHCCYLTKDGEHHNYRGARLITDIFTATLLEFLTLYDQEQQIKRNANNYNTSVPVSGQLVTLRH